MYFGRTKHTTLDQYKLQDAGAIIAGILFSAIILLWGLCQSDISWLITPDMSKYTLFILGGIIFFFADVLPFTALLAAFITPRPYLNFLEYTDIWTQLVTLTWGMTLTIGAFMLQKMYAKKFLNFINSSHNLSLVWWHVRIPWLILMVWTYLYL